MYQIFLIIFFCFTSILSADNAEIIAKVKNYFYNIENISTNFTQIDKDGTIESGRLYIKNKEKVRMEYGIPNELIMQMFWRLKFSKPIRN